MSFDAVNRERLHAQAKRMDKLSQVYFNQFLYAYINGLEKASPSSLRVNVLFDDSSTRIETDKPDIPHGNEYFAQLTKRLYGSNANINSTEVSPGIFSVGIEKPLANGKNYTEMFFDQVTEPRVLQFSKGLSIIPLDKYGEPIHNLAIFLGEQDYLQFLPKIPGPTAFFTPKTQYRGRTTYEVAHYFTADEKELIKKQVSEILQNHEVRLTIFAECENREVAYEKLVPPGEEEHQRWRVKLVEYEWLKPKIKSPVDLEDMLYLHDWLSIYPKLKQKIETDEGVLELQTRLVLETDPRTSTLEYTGFVFDKMSNAVKNLGLPFRRFHSGSASPRIHIEIDAEDILNNAVDICKNFSFIGAGVNPPIKSLKDAYNTIISALVKSIYLYTWNKAKYYGSPKITRNKFSPEYDNCLFDCPTNVSISGGSPKGIIRLDQKSDYKIRKIMENIDPRYRNIPVTVSMCTPLMDNELAPNSLNGILQLCNPISAMDRFNRMYATLKRKMSEKMTSNHVKQILDKTPRQQFKDLHILDEKSFRVKHSKTQRFPL